MPIRGGGGEKEGQIPSSEVTVHLPNQYPSPSSQSFPEIYPGQLQPSSSNSSENIIQYIKY